ncbi:dihydrolipoyl dehydrogenase [Plasmopara halstedii]|uniref:Dihydrolipoyl dehydrogenase n=1 Tax=Plasmopara halstedii TaxID=4781 RepID=A0A0P1AGF2_PLAHL|nr:dihydrolipoyl dehydrogenase [Plasmopara halstedii]CEG39706.1 dihydrolipoyl dehydrogenase [Plasmopara halstedii]|eukprot:XP_024576075.1 dihydrolipoyl dehydrogenase [Plasmopara halstedii]
MLYNIASISRRSAIRHHSITLRAFSSSSEYDVVVIGGGPGGYVAAIKAAQLGMKTACIESRGKLGGTCLNVGCIPSKALLHSTHLLHTAQHEFKNYGIDAPEVTANFPQMMKAKDKAVKTLTSGIESLFKKNKVTYIKGSGKISAQGEVSVALHDHKGNETVKAKNIIIATGSEVTPLPPVPVDNAAGKIVDSTGALELKRIPDHLVVVGAGVIGLELGSVYKRLGAKVTVVEYLDDACTGMDKGSVKDFIKLLKKQGLEFKFGTKVTASEINGDVVKLTTEPSQGGDAASIECDTVLVATGRRAFTAGLGLEQMGIQTDKFGRIEVDEAFRTQVPGIFAIGDVIKGAMLAHKAEEEGIACAEIIAGKHGHVNYGAIPGVIYTFPEFASVGKTEEELKAEGIEYNVGKFPMMANSRARTVGESDGMVKVLADKKTDKLLGVHIIASNAGEMISEGVIGIEYGAASEDVARTSHAHPTLSEAFKEACLAAYDKPINF